MINKGLINYSDNISLSYINYYQTIRQVANVFKSILLIEFFYICMLFFLCFIIELIL